MCSFVKERQQQGVHAASCLLQQLLHFMCWDDKPLLSCLGAQIHQALARGLWISTVGDHGATCSGAAAVEAQGWVE